MEPTHVVAVILARAGSKGLPNKNILPVAGRPMIAWTIEAAMRAETIGAICVSSDSPEALAIAGRMGAIVIERPPQLATDDASVMDATRHAIECYEAGREARPTSKVLPKGATGCVQPVPNSTRARAVEPPVAPGWQRLETIDTPSELRQYVSHVVILYGNVPVRPPGIIDRAVRHLIETGADSVRSLRRVEKQHPDWLHVLVGDRIVQYRRNSIHRRQDLEPLYYHDGAVVAAMRASLFGGDSTDPHSFFGQDRRGVLCEGGPTVDVDSQEDLKLAEALLALEAGRQSQAPQTSAGHRGPISASRRP